MVSNIPKTSISARRSPRKAYSTARLKTPSRCCFEHSSWWNNDEDHGQILANDTFGFPSPSSSLWRPTIFDCYFIYTALPSEKAGISCTGLHESFTRHVFNEGACTHAISRPFGVFTWQINKQSDPRWHVTSEGCCRGVEHDSSCHF